MLLSSGITQWFHSLRIWLLVTRAEFFAASLFHDEQPVSRYWLCITGTPILPGQIAIYYQHYPQQPTLANERF